MKHIVRSLSCLKCTYIGLHITHTMHISRNTKATTALVLQSLMAAAFLPSYLCSFLLDLFPPALAPSFLPSFIHSLIVLCPSFLCSVIHCDINCKMAYGLFVTVSECTTWAHVSLWAYVTSATLDVYNQQVFLPYLWWASQFFVVIGDSRLFQHRAKCLLQLEHFISTRWIPTNEKQETIWLCWDQWHLTLPHLEWQNKHPTLGRLNGAFSIVGPSAWNSSLLLSDLGSLPWYLSCSVCNCSRLSSLAESGWEYLWIIVTLEGCCLNSMGRSYTELNIRDSEVTQNCKRNRNQQPPIYALKINPSPLLITMGNHSPNPNPHW